MLIFIGGGNYFYAGWQILTVMPELIKNVIKLYLFIT